MERHARKAAPLDVPPAIDGLLARWRAASGVTGPAELDVDRVRDVEGTMGTGLPDVLLAMIAAAIPALRDELGLTLGRIAEHSALARARRVRGDFVACGAEPDGSAFYGFLKKTAETHLATFRPDRGRIETVPYLDWLEEQAAADDLDADSPDATLDARLYRDALPEGEGQRVRHPKFGVGRVLAEQGEGPTRRVKAEFPGLGLKVIQARFLEFLDD